MTRASSNEGWNDAQTVGFGLRALHRERKCDFGFGFEMDGSLGAQSRGTSALSRSFAQLDDGRAKIGKQIDTVIDLTKRLHVHVATDRVLGVHGTRSRGTGKFDSAPPGQLATNNRPSATLGLSMRYRRNKKATVGRRRRYCSAPGTSASARRGTR